MRGIKACIPARSRRKAPVTQDVMPDRQRHKIEIRFGRLTDPRRIQTGDDRCALTFFSGVCIAAGITVGR
ncbi:hypothetical protein [Aureimonas sp. AU12]|uniref:hypothetical protein n=1 Tax=Aureimonas sp. AU12 TaxID=1638161 RepID=UPI0012E3D689|nr:hypothetical protein [Aureimonas sp. AU12]